jgi:transposase
MPLAGANSHPASSNICVEIQHPRGIKVNWPTESAAACAAFFETFCDDSHRLIWLATEPMDMRAGTETALAKVIAVFGAAQPHCAYLFANRRANRMKVLVHDGFGIWLAARRLNQGKFHWPGIRHGSEMELDAEQLQALVLGLPWQRAGSGGSITLL